VSTDCSSTNKVSALPEHTESCAPSGADNKLAYALSRKTSSIQDKPRIRGSSVEWHLNSIIWPDPVQPNIQTSDRLVRQQLEQPTSDLLQLESRSDALRTRCNEMSWDMTLGYAFPPIALIPRVLEKLHRSEACELILIAPKWSRQLWFPRLLSLLAGPQLLFHFKRTSSRIRRDSIFLNRLWRL